MLMSLSRQADRGHRRAEAPVRRGGHVGWMARLLGGGRSGGGAACAGGDRSCRCARRDTAVRAASTRLLQRPRGPRDAPANASTTGAPAARGDLRLSATSGSRRRLDQQARFCDCWLICSASSSSMRCLSARAAPAAEPAQHLEDRERNRIRPASCVMQSPRPPPAQGRIAAFDRSSPATDIALRRIRRLERCRTAPCGSPRPSSSLADRRPAAALFFCIHMAAAAATCGVAADVPSPSKSTMSLAPKLRPRDIRRGAAIAVPILPVGAVIARHLAMPRSA